MVKFVLMSIAVVLIMLSIYIYNNQTVKKISPISTFSETKKEVLKEEFLKETPAPQKHNISVKSEVLSSKKEDSNSNTMKSYDKNMELDYAEYDPNVNRISNELMTNEDFEKAESDTLRNQYIDSDIDIVEDLDSIDFREITES